MSELDVRTLAELSDGLATGELTSLDATKHVLERIDRFDGRHGLNAFLEVAAIAALKGRTKQICVGRLELRKGRWMESLLRRTLSIPRT